MPNERSDAQRRADIKYRSTQALRRTVVGGSCTREEAAELRKTFADADVSIIEVLRRAAFRIRNGLEF